MKLSFSDEDGVKTWDAIGFGYGAFLAECCVGDKLDIAYEVGFNEWNGRRSVQLRLIDVKL